MAEAGPASSHRATNLRLPSTRTEFWETKISNNIDRGRRNFEERNHLGWRVITVWECELKNKADREETVANLVRNLNLI